jgi:hypothetical protein
MQEKEILEQIGYPFLVSMLGASQASLPILHVLGKDPTMIIITCSDCLLFYFKRTSGDNGFLRVLASLCCKMFFGITLQVVRLLFYVCILYVCVLYVFYLF